MKNTHAWHVGIKANGEYEAFKPLLAPTQKNYENQFIALIGPFRTKRGACYMAKYGGKGNPHLQHVADAERFARQEVTKPENLISIPPVPKGAAIQPGTGGLLVKAGSIL